MIHLITIQLLLQSLFSRYVLAYPFSNSSATACTMALESDYLNWLDEDNNLSETYIPELSSSNNYPELSEAIIKYASYGATSYCPRKGRLITNEEDALLNEVCDTKFCESSYQIYVRKIIQGDVTALIFEDTINRELIISFKGTSGKPDWLINLNYPFADYQPFVLRDKMTNNKFDCNDPKLHRGFSKGYESFHNSGGMKYVINYLNNHPDYDVVVTGHSMGGAISEICAVELFTVGFRPTVFNYGTPKVFNKGLAEWVDSKYGLHKDLVKGGFYRVTNNDDLVILFPLSQQGFYHVGSEVCIDADRDNERIVSMTVLGKFDDKREKVQFRRLLGKFLARFRSHLMQGIRFILQAEAHKFYPVSMGCSR